MERPSWQDIALPLVLLTTGLVLVSGDCFGYLSLDRIASFWPVGILLIGLTGVTRVERRRPAARGTVTHAR